MSMKTCFAHLVKSCVKQSQITFNATSGARVVLAYQVFQLSNARLQLIILVAAAGDFGRDITCARRARLCV